MAEQRKSDFTGDAYGAWVVTGRAPAQSKKRAWHVQHIDGSTKVVLQTELTALGNSPAAPFVPGIHQAVTDEEKAIEAQTYLWWHAGDLDTLDEHDEPSGPFPHLTAGPGDCKHGVQIKECAECWALLGADGKAAYEKYPSKFKGSAEITASVLAANVLHREAVASVALDNDPEIGTYTLNELGSMAGDPWEPYVGDVDPNLVECLDCIEDNAAAEFEAPTVEGNGLGEHVNEEVTEEQLDALVPPQDELRKAIRVLMGQVHDYRISLATVAAELQVRVDDLAGLMDSVDAVMKQAVQR